MQWTLMDFVFISCVVAWFIFFVSLVYMALSAIA